MLKKLRLKFILINMTIVALMLTVIFTTVYQMTKNDLEKQGEATLLHLTQSVQRTGEVIREEPVRQPYFTIHMNAFGELFAAGNTYLDLSDSSLLRELSEIVLNADTSTGRIDRYNLLFSRVMVAGGLKMIFVDITGQEAALASLIRGSIYIGLASLIVFLGISILLARWAIKPVEQAWEQQKQFISDASHELKTPLTVIMSNAELLETEDCTPENRQRFTGSILTMSRHMKKLIEGMLELARADNGRIQMNFAPVDMSGLAEDTVLPFEPVFYEKGLLLESSLEPGIWLTGSAGHLRQVVEILLDNASKYSAPGVVVLQLQRQGKGKCLLTVSNPGNPIPKEDLERIFTRFYRAEEARSRTGSFGLGLAIARSIVEEHKGKIWAESNQTGNCFSVLLPTEPGSL